MTNLFPKKAKIREDLTEKIHNARLIKSPAEIKLMKESAQATAQGLIKAMKEVKPGMKEHELARIIEKEFTKHTGSKALAFPSIVATGRNAIELHHPPTASRIKEKHLVLCDVGAEYKGYAADVTRTFPANGKFTKEQKKVYEICLEAMKQAEKKLKEGVTLGALHQTAENYVSKKGYNLGHSLSHFVGLSVHDVGTGGKLKAGMVITIEPGIYLQDKGIGIRIEDTYLVTKDGFERLSQTVPREIDEIEALMSQDKKEK
jgi:Xaa-Pro aminopeptidase